MTTQELLKKIRKIEIKTRGLSKQVFSGEYHSAFKGRGMAFSENREYQHGDEIRTIDWNVTARMRRPYVKVFEEERELTAVLLIDLSASESFGTTELEKRQLIAEVTAVLAFSAAQNNDKIGAILYTDKIERFIPPKKGRHHILGIIRELLDFTPEGKNTNTSMALEYLNRVIKKRCICFMLSDFLDTGFEHALKISNQKHDVVALRISDPRETEVPNMGWVQLTDPELDKKAWINTSSRRNRKMYRANALQHSANLIDTFKKAGVDHVTIQTDRPYVQPLMNLFKHRG
jgi:uncharacterized protein (DUF58 family)